MRNLAEFIWPRFLPRIYFTSIYAVNPIPTLDPLSVFSSFQFTFFPPKITIFQFSCLKPDTVATQTLTIITAESAEIGYYCVCVTPPPSPSLITLPMIKIQSLSLTARLVPRRTTRLALQPFVSTYFGRTTYWYCQRQLWPRVFCFVFFLFFCIALPDVVNFLNTTFKLHFQHNLA